MISRISIQKIHLDRVLTIVSFFVLFQFSAIAQQRFDSQLLNTQKINGLKLDSLFTLIETNRYDTNLTGCLYLKSAYNSSKFINQNEWIDLKDKVEPYRIDLVYSKYPVKNGVYNEIYPLLFSRLRSLFEIDPYLNDASIEWNKILQTNCANKTEVNSLFHGVVIWYRIDDSKTFSVDESEQQLATLTTKKSGEVESVKISKSDNKQDQVTVKELEQSVRNIKSFSFIPDSLVRSLSSKPIQDQILILKNHLEKELETEPERPLSKATKEELLMYKKEIEDFLLKFPAEDSVVINVFDRHPEWKNSLVINDWTGSMYGYGAQVLLWHVNHFEKSGIKAITLFNDGNSKKDSDKQIGKTGGVYTEVADEVLKLQKTFNYVMLEGMGGDEAENDIEAVLKAIQTTPYHSEIILIADNQACIRDIELVELISEPVKIILCGYDPKAGINPDLVYLARKTNGGIYTLTEDLENLQIDYDPIGNQISQLDKRFKVNSMVCGSILSRSSDRSASLYTELERYDLKLENLENTDLASSRFRKKKVTELILKDSTLSQIPKRVYKMTRLTYLNLSNNRIDSISPKIQKLVNLKNINIAFNRIKTIPKEINSSVYLESLDASHNKLTTFPIGLTGMKFLKTINLSYNQITKIDNISKLKKLEKLNLSNNKIKEIGKEIGSLKKLTSLNLADNSLKSLPASIVNLTNLVMLNLKDNNLTSLPLRIEKLKKLKYLNLENNNFSEEEQKRIKDLLKDTTIYF